MTELVLPDIGSAQLPALYETAKETLAECQRVDECKAWADKAAALASYAKQSADESLEHFAMRIRARAIRRAGELLHELRPAPGGRPSENKPMEAPLQVSRSQAARDAGMTPDQKVQALRVATIPEPTFTAALDAPKPATVTKLAALGTKPAPKPLVDLGGRDPAEFQKSTTGQGEIRRLAEFAVRVRPEVIVRGAFAHEISELSRNANIAIGWLSELIAALEGKS